jgi:hypothetical protein
LHAHRSHSLVRARLRFKAAFAFPF